MLGVGGNIELRFVRRGNFLLIDSVPVDAVEPRVLLDVLSISGAAAQTPGRVLIKQLHQQVSCGVTQEREVDAGVRIFDVFV